MKVLFLIPHLNEAASNRYRVYQYLPYLNAHGIETTVRPFVDSQRFYRLLYRRGHTIPKVYLTVQSLLRRSLDLLSISKFDGIFIQREALPFGPAWLERMIASQNKPIIYDFDDAIYLPNISKANKHLLSLKFPSKTATITRLAKYVIVGNTYLYKYAVRFNQNISIIPTAIDTSVYTLRPDPGSSNQPVSIGWIGSHSTIEFLHQLDPVFQRLSKVYPVRLVVIGSQFNLPGIQVISKEWKFADEVTELQSLDIGVMPMPDNEWTRGKSGLKALQYMAVGVPAVTSPVGVNTEIIHHAENGFLARSEEEWIECLSALIENPDLRYNLGLAGRETVEEHYSLEVNAPKLLDIFHRALSH